MASLSPRMVHGMPHKEDCAMNLSPAHGNSPILSEMISTFGTLHSVCFCHLAIYSISISECVFGFGGRDSEPGSYGCESNAFND